MVLGKGSDDDLLEIPQLSIVCIELDNFTGAIELLSIQLCFSFSLWLVSGLGEVSVLHRN